MQLFDDDNLAAAQESMQHSAGTPYGQSVAFDADAFHEVLALIKAVRRGEIIGVNKSS